MVHRALLAAIFAVCCFSLSDLKAVPVPKQEVDPQPRQQENRTVMPGTWAWSIETNKVGGLESSDLSWSQQTATERYLEPINGAAMKVVTEPFDKIDLAYLKGVALARDKISGSDNNNMLKPGTVLAVRTANGNLAKLKVTRFYKLHDFTFPGSEVLTQEWKESASQTPNRDYYHIEFEWVLYKSK